MLNSDSENKIFHQAVSFVNQTGKHLFLTGNAGTGKTTFLKYIKENTFKKMAVVAPTGVAAINAGGVTIHSLFQLPFGSFIPTAHHVPTHVQVHNKHTLLQHARLNTSKRELLKELELLIIDEISMVRADVLDAIDVILRHVRQQPLLPFGGVQMLYIGDVYQLPPVAKQEEWELLREFYRSPFFFDSVALQESPPVFIELKKIYRQKDDAFISLLNNVRNNRCTENDLQLLNSHYDSSFKPAEEDKYIFLTSHNHLADTINRNELSNLPGSTYSFKASVSGDFYERAYPAEENISLKEGAQIMFIKNDKGEERRYYNGKIGTVKKLTQEAIEVEFENGDFIEVQQETWKNVTYDYNKEEDKIEEEELGSFSQYPIRLAWAITIHKSQGLTFNKAIIDAGASFAPGQVYVALSRLTNLQGLVLHSRINSNCITTDPRVVDFVRQQQTSDDLDEVLSKSQDAFIRQTLIKTFDWNKVVEAFQRNHEGYDSRKIPDKETAVEWSRNFLQQVEEQRVVADKFIKRLEYLFSLAGNEDQILERTKAASAHFTKELDEKLLYPLRAHIKEVRVKKQVKRYLKELNNLLITTTRKKEQVLHASLLAEAIASSNMTEAASLIANKPIVVIEEHKEEKVKTPKGETFKITLEMYKEGKSVTEIASARQLVLGTIEGHLIRFIPTGEIDVHEFVTADKLATLLNVIKAEEQKTSGAIKSKVGDEFSFTEIRAALEYWNMQKN